MINSVTHFLSNGLRNAGMKFERADIEKLAKGLVYDARQNGDLMVGVDPMTGNTILEASPEIKKQAREMARIGDAMTGKSSRNASSTTPQPSGSSFSTGGPKVSKRSLKVGGIVTRAADIVKNIQGSVGHVFRKKDLQRKALEHSLIFHPDFVKTHDDTPGGDFLYSTHPLAKRNGVHEGAYRKAMVETAVPESYDATNPNHKKWYEQLQKDQARQVMAEKKAKMEFEMQSVSNKPGIRYGEYIHSLANQRFFPNSYDLDYMGSKETIRDVVGMAYQDTVRVDHLLDPTHIATLKKLAKGALTGDGKDIHGKLIRLNPSELGAIGMMHTAVMAFYTAFSNAVPNVAKLPPAQAIDLYTPAIANKLADLGEKYNVFLTDPSKDPDPEMMGFWAATEKGEALGALNLIDDFFKVKAAFDKPESKRSTLALSHHAFYDGNQNGIFLQSLFFGQKSASQVNDATVRLSQANTRLNDMRVHAMNTMVDNLETVLHDSDDKASAWRAFWKDATAKGEYDEVSKDVFKKPLMQNVYGKHASMFGDVLYSLLEGDETYNPLAQKYLVDTGAYPSIAAAVESLSSAVEMTLNQLIDSMGANTMKSIGRAFALYNSPAMIPGVTGDTYVVGQVGFAPMAKRSKNKGIIRQEVDGKTIFLKKPDYVADKVTNPATGESQDIVSTAMQFQPNFSVGKKNYWNRMTQKFDEFNNPKGMSLARQMVVLLIQALDGDLVKWSTIEANKGLSIPRPVMWVHDSIISTPGQALVYANMYNNVAIPGAVHEIAKLGPKLKEAMKAARDATIKSVLEREEPVGIGDEGEYASIGALFDEYANRIDPNFPRFKEIFIKSENARAASKAASHSSKRPRSQFDSLVRAEKTGVQQLSPEQKWENYRQKYIKLLNEAEKLGWVPAAKMDTPEGRENRKYLAVSHENFPKLLELAEEIINVGGPSARVQAWLDQFPQRVKENAKTLHMANKPGEIAQMTQSGNKKPADLSGKKILPTAKIAKPHEEELLVPKDLPPPGNHVVIFDDKAFDGEDDYTDPF
jgi:hypothetical protein